MFVVFAPEIGSFIENITDQLVKINWIKSTESPNEKQNFTRHEVNGYRETGIDRASFILYNVVGHSRCIYGSLYSVRLFCGDACRPAGYLASMVILFKESEEFKWSAWHGKAVLNPAVRPSM